MAKKILFRADGNSTTGLGHLYRSFALVEMYKANWEFCFMTRSDSTLSVIPGEYNVIPIPHNVSYEEEIEWYAALFPSEEYLMIIDGYQFDAKYQEKLKTENYFFIYIDDLRKDGMCADIVINHSPSVIVNDYTIKDYTTLALGTKYSILRPSFLKAATQPRVIEKLDNCFVCFGGADMYNLTSKAIEALLELNGINEIHAVMGAANLNNKLIALGNEYDKITIHQNLSERELIDVMNRCNFAIAPASTILYEVCAVNMPAIGGYYVENQKEIYKGLVDNKAILGGGILTNYTKEMFKDIITQLRTENKKNVYILNQSRLFDDKIKERFLSLF